MDFKLTSPFQPTGDQPQAIEQLVGGVRDGEKTQVLLGVTGSGKTFTMANVIAQLNTFVTDVYTGSCYQLRDFLLAFSTKVTVF